MKLEGKSLEMFEAWYAKCYEKENLPYIQGFYVSSFSCQYGVYVDFFETVDMYLIVYPEQKDHWVSRILAEDIMSPFYDLCEDTYSDSQPQARQQAISKAMEILNDRK
jgi:hypothetical protein